MSTRGLKTAIDDDNINMYVNIKLRSERKNIVSKVSLITHSYFDKLHTCMLFKNNKIAVHIQVW